jgi:hypothetical protein
VTDFVSSAKLRQGKNRHTTKKVSLDSLGRSQILVWVQKCHEKTFIRDSYQKNNQ